MKDDKKKPIVPQVPSDDEQPEIYGVKKGTNGIVLNRRSFLGVVAASGVLAGCIPLPFGLGEDEPPVPAAPAAPAAPQGCGKSNAHAGSIEGLWMQDASLFSWDAKTLNAWEFAKGSLKKSLSKETLQENLKKNADIFPDLFLHIWDAPLRAYGPGGKLLAVSGQDGVALWQSVKGKLNKSMTLTGAAQPVRALAFHPVGTMFAAGSEDGSITIWRLKDGKVQQRIQGDSGPVLSLAVHPDGALLLSGHQDGKVRAWQLPEGKAGETFLDHGSAVLNMEITPNGVLAVTAGEDGTVKLWNMPGGTLNSSLVVPPSEKTTAMDVSQDSQILAAGTSLGHIYLWRLPEEKMMGCLFDPALTPKDTQMSHYRQMGAQILTQPCGTPLPPGATCVCDCVASSLSYHTTQTVCICDTIAVPAGYDAVEGVCICNTIAVGSKPAAPSCSCVGHVSSPCACVGNVSSGGSHYWRPN